MRNVTKSKETSQYLCKFARRGVDKWPICAIVDMKYSLLKVCFCVEVMLWPEPARGMEPGALTTASKGIYLCKQLTINGMPVCRDIQY